MSYDSWTNIYPTQTILAIVNNILETNSLFDSPRDIAIVDIELGDPSIIYSVYVSPMDTSSEFLQFDGVIKTSFDEVAELLSGIGYPDSTSLIVKQISRTVWARYRHRDNESSSYTINFNCVY